MGKKKENGKGKEKRGKKRKYSPPPLAEA